MLYSVGGGHELLSASIVLAVCHDSSVFLVRLLALSMLVELSKSIIWSKVHACFATFKPLAQCFVFLTCSFLLVLNAEFRPPEDDQRNAAKTVEAYNNSFQYNILLTNSNFSTLSSLSNIIFVFF